MEKCDMIKTGMGGEKGKQSYYEDLPGFVPVCSVCGAEWHTAMMHAASSAAFDIEFFVVPLCGGEGHRGNDLFASKPSFVSLREPISLETKDSGNVRTDETQTTEGYMIRCNTRRSLRGFDSVSLLTVSPCDITDTGFYSDEDDLQYDEDLQEFGMEDLYDGTEGGYEDDEEEELKAALQRQGSELFLVDEHDTNTDTELYDEQDDDDEVDEELFGKEGKVENSMLLGWPDEEDDDALVVPPLEDGDFSSDDEDCDGGCPYWGPRAFKPVFVARTGRKFTLPKTAAKPAPKIAKQEDEAPEQGKRKENSSVDEKQSEEETKNESTVEPEETVGSVTKTTQETDVQEAPIIGRCASEKCIRDSRIIRDTDDRVEVRCSLKRPCVVWYHLKCWRLYDKAAGISTSTDKNHVGCVTPDCEGFIKTIRRFTRRSGDIKEHVTEFRKNDYIDPIVTHNDNSESSGSLALSQSAGETNGGLSWNKKGKKKPESDTKKDVNETALPAKTTAPTQSTLDKQKEKKGTGETTEATEPMRKSLSEPFVDSCTRKDKNKAKSTRKQSSDVDPGAGTNAVAAVGQSATRTATRLNSEEMKQSLSKPPTQPREGNTEHIVIRRPEQAKSADTSRTGITGKSVGVQSGNMWESKTSLRQLKASLRGSSSETSQTESPQDAQQTCASCPKDSEKVTLESKVETPETVMSEETLAFVVNSRQQTLSIVKTNESTQPDPPTKNIEDGPKFVVSAPAFIPRTSNCNESSTNTQQKPAWTSASTPFLPGKPSSSDPPKIAQFYVVPFPTFSPRKVINVHASLLGWPFSDGVSFELTKEKDCDDCIEGESSEETEALFTTFSRVLTDIVDSLIGKESPTITIIPPPSFPMLKVRQSPATTQTSPPLSTDFPPLGLSSTPPSSSPFCVSSSWSPQKHHN